MLEPNLTAEIIAIGSEMLTPRFQDTNSLYLTDQLNAVGIPVVMKTIVGDDEQYLEQAVRGSLARTPLFQAFNIEQQIEKIRSARVDLPSGGYIIIQEAEGLCAIDVNTGKFTGKKSQIFQKYDGC